MNKQLKHEINTRNYLKKKAAKPNSPSDWLLFKKKWNAFSQFVKKTKKLYYQKEIESSSRNPKGTWKFLYNLMGKKTKNIQIT